MVADQPLLLVVRKDLPATNLQEFIAYAKANQARCSSARPASARRCISAASLFNAAVGIEHHPHSLPRRRAGDDGPDRRPHRLLLQVHHHGDPQVPGNTIKPLAILALKGSPLLPDLPTAQRAGPGRLRGRDLERGVPAQGHAARNRAEAQRRAEPGGGHRPGRTAARLGMSPAAPDRRSPEFLGNSSSARSRNRRGRSRPRHQRGRIGNRPALRTTPA